MELFKNQLLSISTGEYTKDELVSILILCASELDINTVSEMARKENKTPRGINISNQYRKIMIGKQKFVVRGLSNNNMPFWNLMKWLYQNTQSKQDLRLLKYKTWSTKVKKKQKRKVKKL